MSLCLGINCMWEIYVIWIVFFQMTYAYINILLLFRDCLAFATEPIFASLANILGKHDNMPSQISPEFKVDISLFCLVHVVCKEWVYIASVWAASQILVPYSNCNHQISLQ